MISSGPKAKRIIPVSPDVLLISSITAQRVVFQRVAREDPRQWRLT